VRRISARSGDESSVCKAHLWPRARAAIRQSTVALRSTHENLACQNKFLARESKTRQRFCWTKSMALARYRKKLLRDIRRLFPEGGNSEGRARHARAKERRCVVRLPGSKCLDWGNTPQVFAEQSIDFSVISDLTEGGSRKARHPTRPPQADAQGHCHARRHKSSRGYRPSLLCIIRRPNDASSHCCFCDLVASTALASELDPEDSAAMISNVSNCPAMHLHQC
jgi:hypothetical protein